MKLSITNEQYHSLVNLMFSISGDASNISEGITNDKQIPRIAERAKKAMDILREISDQHKSEAQSATDLAKFG